VSLLSLLLYIPVQIAFFPLALVGTLLVAYRQLVVSKRLGVSQTAIEVLNGRWTMHVFGIRADDACARLAAALPNTSLMGLWLVLFPLWLKFKISGRLFLYPRVPEPGAEGLAELIVCRTLYFDRIIERAIDGVEQFVVMGAGYDTRAYGNLRREGVEYFELDQTSVQQHKREVLGRAGIPSEHVHFVPVDFSRENAFEKLSETDFDRNKKTLFLWEGVTLYLSEADVRRTMQDLHDHAPAGSVLLADIYADWFVNIGKRSGARKVLDYTDEGFGFSLALATNPEQALLDFVQSESLAVGEAYFLGNASKNGPFMVVVEMRC
jgi:methyltransferase (TIGR00027 family)